jgi:hypothetical protein
MSLLESTVEQSSTQPTIETLQYSILTEMFWIKHLQELSEVQNPDLQNITEEIKQQRFAFIEKSRITNTLTKFISYRSNYLLFVSTFNTTTKLNQNNFESLILPENLSAETLKEELFHHLFYPIYKVIKENEREENIDLANLEKGLNTSINRINQLLDVTILMQFQNSPGFNNNGDSLNSLIAITREQLIDYFLWQADPNCILYID